MRLFKKTVLRHIDLSSGCSDDDLEPFDLSHDVKINKVKTTQPLYLRDCMEGLSPVVFFCGSWAQVASIPPTWQSIFHSSENRSAEH